jgi:quercetin dioxygenase-like cupin family protein
MSGMFLTSAEVARETLDWGTMGWCCRPKGTGMKNLVVIEVEFGPGGGHAFHKHPDQEEVIYCISGEVEQWLDQKKQILKPGDSIIIPAGTVHASFATSGGEKLLAILSPAIDDADGYAVEEVADQEPYASLR